VKMPGYVSASVHYRDTDIRHLGRNENAIA
jgi:hypothetical protein